MRQSGLKQKENSWNAVAKYNVYLRTIAGERVSHHLTPYVYRPSDSIQCLLVIQAHGNGSDVLSFWQKASSTEYTPFPFPFTFNITLQARLIEYVATGERETWVLPISVCQLHAAHFSYPSLNFNWVTDPIRLMSYARLYMYDRLQCFFVFFHGSTTFHQSMYIVQCTCTVYSTRFTTLVVGL